MGGAVSRKRYGRIRRSADVNLRALFDPESIAVIGASATEGKLGYEAMRSVAGADVPVHPVNPNGDGAVFGEPFVGSIGDVEGEVDLALCCVPAPIVPDVVAECGEAGVAAAIVYAGGFAEAGEEGETLQADLIAAAEAHDVALLGPNTSGYFMPHRGLYTSFVSNPDVVEPGDVAVVAQSGGIAHSLAFQGVNEGWGFSGVVGLGNRAVVGFEPVVEYFDDDPNTDAIVLHVEGTEDARSLLETCEVVETPIAAYPVGEEDVDAFAASHTGALTGEYALYRAGFEQYGVPVLRGTTDLLDAGHVLANAPVPDGPNVGVVTAQAGPGIVIADKLQARGCRLPPLAEETQDAVGEYLAGTTYAENPVDTGRPMPGFDDLVGAVARDPNVDAVLVYMVYEEAVGFPPTGIAEIPGETAKPVIFATDGPDEYVADDLADLEASGVPAFQSPERGADAMGALVRYAMLNDGEGRTDGDPGADGRNTGGENA